MLATAEKCRGGIRKGIQCGIGLFLLAACQPVIKPAAVFNSLQTLVPFTIPTTNPIFLSAASSTPGAEQAGSSPSLLSPVPRSASTDPTLFPQPAIQPVLVTTPSPEPVDLAMVYDENLAVNWAVQAGGGVAVQLQDSSRAHGGKHSLACSFQQDGGSLTFQVRPGTEISYPRSRVVGITFWLNSGSSPLAVDDLGLAVVGSSLQSYWLDRDPSVSAGEFVPDFSAGHRYLLGFNQAVPPGTWIQVDLDLADLTYDTGYRYLTGLRINNNVGFQQKIYIDDLAVKLLSPD